MIFTTTTQFAVLILMLIIGWLFGLASHPGGKKWKQSYRDEQAARAKDVAERDARIKELEASNATLAAERDRRTDATPAVAATAATAASADKRSWFAWRREDDLTKLRGVDAELARQFKAEGVTGYAALAGLSDHDETALEDKIDLPDGYIRRERLREQARLLVDGRADEHSRDFG